MTKEELIEKRDKCTLLVSKYAKRKRPFAYIFSFAFLISLILLIVDASLINNISGETNRPPYYYILFWIGIGFMIAGFIVLLIFIILHILEKKYQKERDLASNRLLGLSLRK